MKRFSFFYTIAAIALAFVACSSPTEPADTGGAGGGEEERPAGTYAGTKSSVTYTLTMSPPTSLARATHEAGDDYVLTVKRSADEKTSTGKVKSVSGSVHTLQPSFVNEETGATAPTFTAAFSAATLTSLSGVITFDDGTTENGPGAFTSGGGSGGGGRGGGGGGTVTHTHTWGAWVVTTPATCTTAGVETRVCSTDASHKETRATAIDPNAHHWGEWTQTQAPTETQSGVEIRTCTHNSSHKETRVVSPTGEPGHTHDWGAWQITTPATCIAEGEEKRVCSTNSSHYETNPIEALGHEWGAWETKTATVTEDGMEIRTCTHDASHKETQFSGEYATGTIGLAYELINGNAYRVRQGTVTSGEVHIPAWHRPNVNAQYLPVTEIGSMNDNSGAFYGSNPTSVTIPSSVTTIGRMAFDFCTSLTGITIPASVTTIGECAFRFCTNLSSVNIPEGVAILNNETFNGCTSLTSVTIPASVFDIRYYAFQDCTSLATVTFAADGQLTYISSNAFGGCTSLRSIEIPASVQSMATSLRGCTNLASITVDANNPYLLSEDGVLYNKAKTMLITCPPAKEYFTIPSSVTIIGSDAFRSQSRLTSIIIPPSVQTIDNFAFSTCPNLTSIIIPLSVTFVRAYAFSDWTPLQTIYVEGFASQAAADAVWYEELMSGNWDTAIYYWRDQCNATIKYWNGSEYI